MPSERGAEGVQVEQTHKSWVAKARALPRQVWSAAMAQVQKRYQALKHRYGPRYTKAMLSAAFLAFFLPLPGSSLVGVALLVVIAEVHRTLSRRGGLPEATADRVVVAKTN